MWDRVKMRPGEVTAPLEQMHERARRLLAAGDAPGALVILEQLVSLASDHLPFWLSLSAVLRVLGYRDRELAALQRALSLDPKHLVVLLQKAAVLDLMGRPRAAAEIYTNALQTIPAGSRLPPQIEAHVAHARKRVAENYSALAALMEARLAKVPGASDSKEDRRRVERCLDSVFGKVRIYAPEPTFMLFPFLINFEFFPRDYFPWLGALEAATDSIRDELLDVLRADAGGVQPYIAYADGLPLNQWKELNNSRRWGAYFLWNQGRREDAHLERCPRTTASLSMLPQVDIPGRGPTAFFSLLEPRTTIPPHTGVTNTRLTVHLPLIVPNACRFRVGGETREWLVGKAWVFDDTIEHEATNDSDAARALLIFDIWNPQLKPLERDLIREATQVLADYSDAESNIQGVFN
jgi:aspartyl/asparaginyl beta-hydroxylase (cupin superfamily)